VFENAVLTAGRLAYLAIVTIKFEDGEPLAID
jgi:hypothetical protein